MFRLIDGAFYATLFFCFQLHPLALSRYTKNQPQKTYIDDYTQETKIPYNWTDFTALPQPFKKQRFFEATLAESIVRRVFVDTPNKTISARLRKSKLGKQEGVFEIIKHFQMGRKFPGWCKNGYYARQAIDLKLVALCRGIKFQLKAHAAPIVSPKFIHLHDYLRSAKVLPSMQMIKMQPLKVLSVYATGAIAGLLKRYPETKDHLLLDMLSAVHKQWLHGRVPEKWLYRKIVKICKDIHFSSWESIPFNHIIFRWAQPIRIAAIHALAEAKNQDKLEEIVRECYSHLRLNNNKQVKIDPSIIEQCLLEAPSTKIYLLLHQSTSRKCGVLVDYIYFNHTGSGDNFSKVLNRPSEQEFGHIWRALSGSEHFKEVLYDLSLEHLNRRDDMRTKKLYDAAYEMQSRINHWISVLELQPTTSRFSPESRLARMYSSILEKVLSVDVNKKNALLLLDIFYAAHEHREFKLAGDFSEGLYVGESSKFGRLLFKIRAAKKFLVNVGFSDQLESLFELFLLSREVNGIFLKNLGVICSTFTEEEIVAESLYLQQSSRFLYWFNTNNIKMVSPYAKRCVGRINRPRYEALLACAQRAQIIQSTLLERMLELI